MHYSIFALKEYIAYDLEQKADSLLFKKSKSKSYEYDLPTIFMGKNQIIYAKGYTEKDKNVKLNDIVIDRLGDTENKEVIYAENGQIKGDKLILNNVTKNEGADLLIKSNFNNLTIEHNIINNLNLIISNTMNLSIVGLNKISQSNKIYNVEIIKYLKIGRILTLLNNLIIIVLIFYIFLNIEIKSIINLCIYYGFILLTYFLIDYEIKNIFINLSIQNSIIIIFEFLIIILIGFIIKLSLYLLNYYILKKIR